MKQPTPDVSAADVERILQRDYGPDDAAQVRSLLRETAPSMSPRVLLAVLKLSNGSIQSVRANLEVALRDWRDVVADAEYPTYMRKVPGAGALSPEQRNQIIQADWEQYDGWLNR